MVDSVSEGGLISRNVTINGRRTSLRLEPEMWESLSEIASREGCSVNDIVAKIDRRRNTGGLTSNVRVFVLGYFRSAATERGHVNAGHGVLFDPSRRDPNTGPQQRAG